MPQTTLWFIHDEKKTFEKLTNSLSSKQYFVQSDSYPDFEIKCILQTQNMTISDQNIVFNVYQYSFSGPRNSNVRMKGTLIVFKLNGQIGLIVDKAGYPNALSFLRELCSYTEKDKKTVVCEEYDDPIKDGKLFLWMISKIYHKESKIDYEVEDEEKTIELNSLDGVKGHTRTGLNNVSTQGSDVINMLTTLAFLLESERLTVVGLNISFENHQNIQLEINTHSKLISLDIKPDDYMGAFKQNDICMKDGKIDLTILRAMILLVVHLSLIPTLYSLYKSDSAGTNVKSELISDITDDITERIEALKEKNNLTEKL